MTDSLVIANDNAHPRVAQARVMAALAKDGVTFEDLARALASLDRKRAAFDRGKENPLESNSRYDTYMALMDIVLRRAISYANDRKRKRRTVVPIADCTES